jgi:hypothetical protein
MMTREDASQEENQDALRRRDRARVDDLLRIARGFQEQIDGADEGALGLGDEIARFIDDISNAVGRLEKACNA